MTDGLIENLGYPGIILLLILGGLGVPIPEEAPIVLSAILSHKGAMWWPLALAACFAGVLIGDFVVYFLGYFYGERVLSFRLTRSFLTKAREAQIKGYFHRHGIKILIVGRFAVGFRTAAYLTAGILRLPALKLLLADLVAASLSTTLMFWGGYWFADWIEAGLRELKHYLVLIAALAATGFIVYRYVKARRRAGAPVGPPVLISSDDLPLPPDDLSPSAILRRKTLEPKAPERPEEARPVPTRSPRPAAGSRPPVTAPVARIQDPAPPVPAPPASPPPREEPIALEAGATPSTTSPTSPTDSNPLSP